MSFKLTMMAVDDSAVMQARAGPLKNCAIRSLVLFAVA
jgi:hypothetical protein